MDDTKESTGSTGPTKSIQPKASNKLTLLMRLHWKGRLPLVISYWVVGWLLQAVVVLGVLSGAAFLGRTVGHGLVWLWICCVFLAVFLVWNMVGVWRSATAYEQASNRPWGTLAKLGVIIGIVRLLYEVFTAFR